MNNGKTNNKKAFTLIELLLVIGIIAVLAVVVFVALNPAQRFKDARNSRRTNDVQTILSAVHQSIVDEKGVLPAGLPAQSDTAFYMIGTGADDSCDLTCGALTTEPNCADMATGLAAYLKAIPVDPSGNRDADYTGYAINVNTHGVVSLVSCDAEDVTIEASR